MSRYCPICRRHEVQADGWCRKCGNFAGLQPPQGGVMPIRPENSARYPKNWPAISKQVRADAGNRCEGSPAFPDCRVENGKPHPETGSRVVLTVAHIDHTPENVSRDNLRAWCQRCHNVYDMPMRRAGIAERAKAECAAGDLFGEGE